MMGERAGSSGHDLAVDAATLRALHVPGKPLLLANVWDPPTARVVESCGMQAIATASAAIAPANGHEDHGRMPAEVAFSALRRIAAAVRLPVSADLEDGYGLSPEDFVARLAQAGACGCNLEDSDHRAGGLVDAGWQAERIAGIKAAARASGFDMVLNARVDVHIRGGSIEQGLQRARRYLDAGADCVYPILLAGAGSIREYVAIGRTNILYRQGGLTLAELAALGVARISVGPGLYRLMLKRLEDAVEALRRGDDGGIWD